MPNLIANFLKINDVDAYTGRYFDRSSASLIANIGVDPPIFKRNDQLI